MKQFSIYILGILLPSLAFAAAPRAGTADYLRDVLHLPESRFMEELNPEDRKPFAFATDAGNVEDPAGDVLDRKGMEAKFVAPWGDLTGAALSKDEAAGVWVVEWKLAEAFLPENEDYKIQWLFYADQNGLAKDNMASEGVRGDMDTEWSIERSEEGEWVTDIRWYNKGANFWSLDRKTEATLEFRGDRITLRIPFIEFPKDATPHWRVLAAVADAQGATQIDVAPGIGFPASRLSIEAADTASRFTLPKPSPAAIILGIAALVALVYVISLRLARRRKA